VLSRRYLLLDEWCLLEPCVGAHHVASYVDELLKGSMSKQAASNAASMSSSSSSSSSSSATISTDSELEEAIDKALILFRYLRDKDIFEDFARNFLNKRLLAHKSVTLDM
jgi:hypothetical protein